MTAPAFAPLSGTVSNAPPHVIDLALAFWRLAAGHPTVEVLTALLEVIAWLIAQSAPEWDAIDPVLDLYLRRLKERTHEIAGAANGQEGTPCET